MTQFTARMARYRSFDLTHCFCLHVVRLVGNIPFRPAANVYRQRDLMLLNKDKWRNRKYVR